MGKVFGNERSKIIHGNLVVLSEFYLPFLTLQILQRWCGSLNW